ncbi:hypothetical protein PSN45_000609 [Yamadazyma tenuis]|uniref:Ribosomal protein L28 n=1 Tax=Candida tenuis (strain ATCC 10573 / BCRC 21748 / CBS 615 / JCM 9827 / NBRC 10315 / NRRL Y-1498 / VKM Y-70) TaxID=590646 RepID=G3B9K5_CANTC|nr:uncharacterized protein CANTEDRAFT_115360 [Yamadazyma tenuis ATCC 10573]EGV61914.1 hypothetical protein CANTEDRAFT_115360 [Yamadazyma tenuis ATCC 10573]WEJ93148.1 hypothetical protein PSN45_000609 [Yamadazyma tenuis]
MLTFTRGLTTGSRLFAPDKYYKITRYAKPLSKVSYKAGDVIPADRKVSIPPNKRHYPLYEYETMFFKSQNRGLYGGLQRTSSRTCSESGNKNLRSHKPNIVSSSIYSEILDKVFKVKVSTRVLKTISKEGGLDNYLLKDKPARIKTMGKVAWRIKYDIMKKLESDSLPVIEGKRIYLAYKGHNVYVGKNKLLSYLFEYAKRDTYEPITESQFLATNSWKDIKEVCQDLEKYSFDFKQVSV